MNDDDGNEKTRQPRRADQKHYAMNNKQAAGPLVRKEIPPELLDIIEGAEELTQAAIGDVVPYAFFRLRPPGKTSGVSHCKAAVLAYILSWYKPKVVRIDGTTVWRKRFSGELLTLHFQEMATTLGYSYNAIRKAVKSLDEEDGLIARGRIEGGGQTFVKVIPNVGRIAKLVADYNQAKANGSATECQGSATEWRTGPVTV